MADKPYRRKLSNYLLDKSLQLRYVAFVTVLSAVICGSLGYLIYKQEARASQTIEEMIDKSGLGSDLEAAVTAHLQSQDQSLVLEMVGVGLALVIILSVYLVVMTHKVAGPLYKVSLYFDKMRDGYLGTVWPLRKGDMLTDFYDKFQAMHTAVRARHERANEAIGRLLAAADAAGVSREGELGHQLDELKAHHDKRREALS